MRISHVQLKNFRNFDDETVYFGNKAVIIGSNDAGKTNLLYALRLLLDDTLPESKLLPSLYDFNFYAEDKKYSVTIKFCGIEEECVLAKLKGHISEKGELFIKIVGTYDSNTGKRDYGLYVGYKEDKLDKIESRFYLRVLNLRYIESSRDLERYIKKEKNWLLDQTKSARTEPQCETDEKSIKEINHCLDCISSKVSSLNYVKNSTELINKSIKKLSNRNKKKRVTFSATETDSRIMIERLALSAEENANIYKLSGDGFSNQTHLSLWAARNELEQDGGNPASKVTIYCIEEIEAHLHPHNQRVLAHFLYNYFDNDQVILTTHSPQIASQFSPEDIVALWSNGKRVVSFGHHKSNFHLKRMINFGYRMNAISAELYFAGVAFFVEGPSEVLLYKALAKALEINLDYYNISIIDVSGVGFLPYCDIADSLGKEFVLRTDKDISKIPRKEKHRFAGVLRGVQIARAYWDIDPFEETDFTCKDLSWDGKRDEIPQQSIDAMKTAIEGIEGWDIFISNTDLENDLVKGTPFGEHVKEFFKVESDDAAVAKLQQRKAINMYNLLLEKGHFLKELKDTQIAKPLYAAKGLAD